MAKKKSKRKKREIVKPFADGTMSNSAFFGLIRSALRNKSRWFKPILNCKLKGRIPYKGSNKRRKWMYICEDCGGEFDSKEVQVHHKTPVGTLTKFEDLPLFVKNLFCDSEGLILVCSACHDRRHEELANEEV